MRVVYSKEDFSEQFQRAVSEAKSAFGDGSVFIEKFISSPKHIEIQILADNYGNIIHLNERECSIQRRHQKVIEEAPSVRVTPEIRGEIGNAAINVARACNYTGAGTVEFLLDDDNNFYFLEMNTRLQVEHPVTEMITGIDIVAEQVRIASGEELSIKQEDVKLNGHSIELRIYAEDPENNFLPSIGKLCEYRQPRGNGIRIDSGFIQGMNIPIYYDPLIAKLIVHDENRPKAIALMKEAIKRFIVKGIKTTLGFGEYVMNNDAYISGDIDTNFVEKYFDKEKFVEYKIDSAKAAALFAIINYKENLDKIREPLHDKIYK
ncbi:MAG: hypothetical protein R2771_13790 [Saprospiraceae bacterium]